ncbi:MAG: CHAD domain-containing protein [Gammaproteobacteria bacterium]
MISLQFELPASVSAEKFIAKLNEKADIQLISQHYCLRTYYDSFDWRLWSNGIVCEFNRSKVSSTLHLRSLKSGQTVASSELLEIPHFPRQLPPGSIKDRLQSLLGVRALLTVCTLEYEAYQLNLLNSDKKTIARLFIEEYELCRNRVKLQPVKGHEQTAGNIARTLTEDLQLVAAEEPLLLVALKLQGRRPEDYSARTKLNLDPTMRADSAIKMIYLNLLKIIKANEQGTIGDIDSEFLHDLRVSVRRTRTGLKQLKDILPDDVTDHYGDFFSWLGQTTGPVRDLDVYLSRFDDLKMSLPEDIREDLAPLYDHLLDKKQNARKDMERKLKSAKYRTALLEWEHYLKQPPPPDPAAPRAHSSIKEVADQSIWKLYKRALQQGETITPDAPADRLHSLRKTCKKLRYLLEFFQSLYPEQDIKPLIKDLKNLQDVLGDFQDFNVQASAIKLFSEEMIRNRTPAKTFLAMGMLIQALDGKKCSVRKHFAERFEQFKRKKNHTACKSLFESRE